jgi:hypothetical protein
VVEELEVAGVAEALLDDGVPDDVLDPELVVELLLRAVVLGLLATALTIGFAAIAPTSPVNATPVSAAVARRVRAAGCRRREPGRPAAGGPRSGERGGGDTLMVRALLGRAWLRIRIHLEHKESASRVLELGKRTGAPGGIASRSGRPGGRTRS